MLNHDEIRLRHMLEAALEAQSFICCVSKDKFVSNRMLLNAVVRSLEVVGEAASQVSNEYRSKYSGIPWKSIISMRNRLIHAYFDINFNLVWSTVKDDIPKLISELENILEIS